MELALSEAVASVRGELGVLALRVEEGELQRDDFIREVKKHTIPSLHLR